MLRRNPRRSRCRSHDPAHSRTPSWSFVRGRLPPHFWQKRKSRSDRPADTYFSWSSQERHGTCRKARFRVSPAARHWFYNRSIRSGREPGSSRPSSFGHAPSAHRNGGRLRKRLRTRFPAAGGCCPAWPASFGRSPGQKINRDQPGDFRDREPRRNFGTR